MMAYKLRKGKDTYQWKKKITKCVTHPKYDGYEFNGYDIAICFLGEEDLGPKNFDSANYS